MNGRLSGVGFPILLGGYLVYKSLPKSELFAEGESARFETVMAGFGAFLLIIGLVFLFRNLK
jgi:hypothetical protein